jgi:ketosteroid isomerase-like protein
MTSTDNRASIERLLAGIDAGDISVMDEVFADDAVMEIPQSGELIAGAANRRAVYGAMPLLPRVTVRRIRGDGDFWTAEATLVYDTRAYAVAFIFEFRDGKIVRETGYWADPFEPPAWREAWVRRESSSSAGSVTPS